MSKRSPPWHILFSLLFCLSLTLAPSLADARAGSSYSSGGKSSSSSMGSRGTRTFENNGAAPVTRSMTQTPSSPSTFGGGAAAPAYAGGGSFFQRHPFLTGIAGGFLGSWLFSGLGGMGHAFGGIFQILIIGLVIWLAFRLISGLIAGRGFSFAGAGGGGTAPRSVGAAAAPGAAPRYRGEDTTVDDSDLNAFQGIHAAVQEAWHPDPEALSLKIARTRSASSLFTTSFFWTTS